MNNIYSFSKTVIIFNTPLNSVFLNLAESFITTRQPSQNPSSVFPYFGYPASSALKSNGSS